MDDIDIATDNVVNTGLAYLDATGGRAAAGEITPLYEANITALRRLRDVCANAPDQVEKRPWRRLRATAPARCGAGTRRSHDHHPDHRRHDRLL